MPAQNFKRLKDGRVGMKVVGTSPDQHVSFKNHYLNFITCFCWEDVERKKISIKKFVAKKPWEN
jgi:hypothetical protein